MFGSLSRGRHALLGALVLCLALAGCGGTKHPATPTVTGVTTTPSWTHAGLDPSGTVWLCRPGLTDNPCEASLATTIEDPS